MNVREFSIYITLSASSAHVEFLQPKIFKMNLTIMCSEILRLGLITMPLIFDFFYLFQSSVVFHIETSHFIWNANHMTGFHMICFQYGVV